MRILAVDPGEKNIGLAVSDPTGTIASPLTVIRHVSRIIDAALIASRAHEMGVCRIIVGCPLDENGEPGPAARKAARLGQAIREQTELPVDLWDESDSTQTARMARIEMRAAQRQRRGHLDEMAAVVILQTYLDSTR
jgi:putative Holliday junction resolvase